MPVRSSVCTYSPASGSSKYSSSASSSSSSTLLPSSLSVGHYKPLGGSSSFASNKFYGTTTASSSTLSSSSSGLGSQRAPSRYNISSAGSTYSPSLSSGSYSSLSSTGSNYSSSAGHYKPLSSTHSSFTGARHATDSRSSANQIRSAYTPRYSSASSTASSSSLGSTYNNNNNNYQPSTYLSHSPLTSSIASRRLSYTSASSTLPADPLPSGVPRGLVNLGNTCYMNASLQSLYAIESFRNLILRSSHCDKLLLSELSDLFKSMKNSSSPVSPVNFKYTFSRQQAKFSGFGQQDAQEFLRYLINSLHDEMNTVSSRRPRRSTPLEAPHSADEAWSQYRTIVDDSALVDILVGQLRSTIICSVCQNKSCCWDPFWDLSLPLARYGRRSSSSGCRLSDVVGDFVAKETLDADERPICSRCKAPTKSTKQINVCRLPKLMILHLKKFTNDGYKMTSPEVIIDDELKFNDTSGSFHLAACISHHGHSSSSGHYTAHCKYSSRWFHFNDDRVRDVTSSFDSSKLTEAYVLFYTQSAPSSGVKSKL